MISRQDFDEIIKDVVNNLYDPSALEAHPAIFSVIQTPDDFNGSKGDYIRQLLTDAINQLQPVRKEIPASSPEWRPYLILQKRYIEGVGVQELSENLAISQRQMRRDHHRALQSLSDILWRRLYPDTPSDDGSGQRAVLEIHNEMVDPVEVIRGVYALLKKQFESKSILVELTSSNQFLPIITDRVILRQILISLMNTILHNQVEQSLSIDCSLVEKQVQINLTSKSQGSWDTSLEDGEGEELTTVRFWCSLIHAKIDESYKEVNGTRYIERRLLLPPSDQKVLLVIDDQETVVSLFKRYLSQTDILPIGVNRPEEAINLARHLLPAIITLDVMMPQIDGWELLQTIKLDEMLKHIPVIICSAWDDPDLSQSLGASIYLKKPITQRMLLDAVEKVLSRTDS